MQYLSVIKFSLVIVFVLFILEIKDCYGLTKVSKKSYPLLKIKIVEKNKKPIKVDAKFINGPLYKAEKRIKQTTFRRRSHILPKFPNIIRERFYGPLHAESSSSSSIIHPLPIPFYNPSYLYYPHISQNYYPTPAPSSIPSEHIVDSNHLKALQSKIHTSVLAKQPTLPSSTTSFGQFDHYIRTSETNQNVTPESFSKQKFLKKYKKYVKKQIPQMDTLNDLHIYGLEKPNQLKHQLSSLNQHYPHPLIIKDNSKQEDADKFLKFMSTQEYFLPKHEPNYKFLDQQILSSTKSQGLFLKEPRSTISYLPLNIQGTQPIAEKLIQHPPTSSISVLPKLQDHIYQKKNFKVKSTDDNDDIIDDIDNDSIFNPKVYYDFAPKNQTTRQRFVRNRHTEPERFEFTEKDAVVPTDPQGDITYGKMSSNHPSTSDISSESSIVTPFRLIIDEMTTTELPNELKKSNEKKLIKPLNYETNVIDQEIKDFCNRQCKSKQNTNEKEQSICGSDGITYENEKHLNCIASCQRTDILIEHRGACKAK